MRLRELEKLGDGVEALVPELLQFFRIQSQKLVRDMSTNCQVSDYEKVRFAAHKLKGSSRDLGFSELSLFCQKIESFCFEKEILKIKYYVNQATTTVLQIGNEIRQEFEKTDL